MFIETQVTKGKFDPGRGRTQHANLASINIRPALGSILFVFIEKPNPKGLNVNNPR
jgi:hypothetical protein